MSIFTRIFGSTADTYANPIGQTTYALARSQTTSTAANNAATSGSIGQTFSTPNYTCRQAFLQFDTSAAPTTGTVSVSINSTGNPTTGGDFIEVSQASSLTDKIAGANLSALTMLGSLAIPGLVSSTRYGIPLTGAPVRNAALKYLLSSRNERLNIAPTATSESLSFNLADITGTTNDPAVDILGGTAWDFVAAGTSVEATATAHTLTEPAGVAAGDLLVACISSRIASTTQITLPSGWTRIGQALNNNTLSTTSALASGVMAYIIRGASAPALTFTHPVAPNVALGRIVAYRNVHQAAPLDSGVTQVTTAINTLAVSVAGLNTTLDDDLIVALTAGGQEATWSAFGATDPATNSGTTSASVLDPIWGQWLERAEQVTGTGNDTSLAVFDAVKQMAGPTGNLVATASLGAGHVVIAGSFKLALPPAVNFGDLVQTSSGTSTTATTAPTLPAPTTAGNLVVLTFAADDYNATVNTGWTESAEMEQQTYHGGYLWWLAATAGMTIPSYTIGSAVRSTWTLAEYKGPVSATSGDGSEGQIDQTFGNIITTPSVTPTSGNRLLVAAINGQHATIDVSSWGSITNSFAPAVQSLFNGGNPRLSIAQLRRVVTANGSTAYSTGGTEVLGTNSRSGLIISFKEAPTGTTYNETVAETLAAAETIVLLTESKARETEAADWRETESGAIRITEGDFFVAPPIEASVAESASPADTVTAALAYTSAIAETAGANETISITLLRIGAIAESASAADTSIGLLTRIGAVVETASAVETTDATIVPAAGIFDVLVVETAPVVDSTAASAIFTRAIAETASAAETIGKALTLAAAVAETAAAVDTAGGLALRTGAIAEAGAATETTAGLLIMAGAVAESASAAETITYSVAGSYNEAQLETAAPAETLIVQFAALGAVAESANAAETSTWAVSYGRGVAETAAAADTIGGLRIIVGAIAERTSVGRLTEAGDWRETEAGVPRGTATTIDTVGGLLVGTTAIVETAAAAETITYSLTGAAGTTYNEAVLEAAAAAEAVAGQVIRAGAIAETASAAETIAGAVTFTKAVVEAATAADAVAGLRVVVGAIAESASAVETTAASVVPAAGVFSVSIAETVNAAETTAGLLTGTAAMIETAAVTETIGAAVIGLPQIIDVTVAESASAADTITADIRRWIRESSPPWANWVEEATAAAAWTRTPSASGLWSPPVEAHERITSDDFQRITDDGRVRITDGVDHYDNWEKELVPANSWQRQR